MKVVLHQSPGWGAWAELSRDMEQKIVVLDPFPPLQLHVLLPLGSPWLIAREKHQQEPHQKSFPLPLLLPVAGEQWKDRAEWETGSLGSTAHVSPETCHSLCLPTDHHSHILHSRITPFSSFSSVSITHCQILYSSGLVLVTTSAICPCAKTLLSCVFPGYNSWFRAAAGLIGSDWWEAHFQVIKAEDISQHNLQCCPIPIHKIMSTDYQSKGNKR